MPLVRDLAPRPALHSWSPSALGDAYGGEGRLGRRIREQLADPLSIAYVLPGLPAEGSGGSHSIVQEALALRAIGARVQGDGRGAAHQASRRRSTRRPSELVHSYRSPRRPTPPRLAGFDVVVATEAPSARLVQEHARASAGVLGAYYVQDYEPLFSPAGGPSADAALLSYRHAEGLLLYAKTHWIANVIDAAHGLAVAKVNPSLDRSVFHSRDRRLDRDPMRVLAMIRPRTPRRRAAETMSALDRIGAGARGAGRVPDLRLPRHGACRAPRERDGGAPRDPGQGRRCRGAAALRRLSRPLLLPGFRAHRPRGNGMRRRAGPARGSAGSASTRSTAGTASWSTPPTRIGSSRR